MSVYSLVYAGTAPIGYMFAGAITDKLGASIALFMCGALTIIPIVIFRLFFSSKDRVKRQDFH